MPGLTFHVQNRINNFWNNLRSLDLKSIRLWIDLIGWLASILLLCLPIIRNLDSLWIIAFCVFWYRLNKSIVNKIKPPIEVLIVFALVFYIADYALLTSSFSNQTTIVSMNFFIEFFHKYLLAFQILFFGLILIRNSRDTQGVLLIYAILAFITLQLVSLDNIYYLYIFQFFIFLSLLKRTIWLESLTKSELWIYLFIFIFLFNGLINLTFFKNISINQFDKQIPILFLPYFFQLLIKIYFIALLVKIPIVLIYNFAGLSRKLKISSLFQTTFPQFIQLLVLLFLFHSFIAGWQSGNLRELFYAKMSQIKSGNTPNELTVIKEFYDGTTTRFALAGYQPFDFREDYPDIGLLSLPKTNNAEESDYFIFTKSTKTLIHDLYFVKLDSDFVKNITGNLDLMLNSGILTHPCTIFSWQELIYRFDFFQDINEVKIFPFGLITNNKSLAIRSFIRYKEDFNGEPAVSAQNEIYKVHKLGVGRMILSVVNQLQDQNSYYAFDIYYDFSDLKFGSTILTLLIMSVGLFFIINSLVIKRVTSFGTEINRIIIQKFEQLKKGIREISAGNLVYKVHLDGEDEFVELADHFNQMGARLQKTIGEARERDILDYELKLARNVQLSLLKTDLPDMPGYEAAAALSTANMVGGDFYDLMQLDNERFIFTIGDVSGKGTSAAFYQAQFLSLLRFTPQFTDQPVEIIMRMNDYFNAHVHDRQIFVTAIVGILNTKKHSVRFVRAGHTLPIYIPDDKRRKIEEIKLDGLGIGLTSSDKIFKKVLEIKEITLEPCDILVFSSDGVAEAAKPKISTTGMVAMEFYGNERFLALLGELRDKTPKLIVEALSKDLDRFYEDHPRIDDHTFLIIQRTGN